MTPSVQSVREPGTRIRYMGNKLALAQQVAAVIADVEPARPLVDLFGGMCSIAGAVSASGRQVWHNDAQHYARLVGHCLLRSQDQPLGADRARELLARGYRANLSKLQRRFRSDLATERRVLDSDSWEDYGRTQTMWRHVGNDAALAREAARMRKSPTGPHRLATLTFAWGFFGLRQCLEIDSVRAAIDAAASGGTVTTDQAAWWRLALLEACSRSAAAPGHFAQYLRGNNEKSFQRIRAARRRSIWDGFLDSLDRLAPYGTKAWRKGNRVLTCDALTVWPKLDAEGLGSAVFYADPPYSSEQYSRFYHVLESLELYDYPESHGAGRYRADRFTTSLAHKAGVLEATRTLCREIAERDGILLLSYPSSGLLTGALGVDVQALLEEYFDDVELVIAAASRHSTMGGRHGTARQSVTEYVWRAA